MAILSLEQQIRDIRELVQGITEQIHPLSLAERNQLAPVVADLETACHRMVSHVQQENLAVPAWKDVPTEQIRKTNDRLTDILDDLNDGFLTLDRNWIITYINRWAAQNGGHEPGDVLGKCIWEVYPQLRGTPLEMCYHEVMNQRVSASFEMKGVIHDQWYIVSIHPTEEGISVYWLDISDRKLVEAEREQSLAENHRLQAEEFRTIFNAITNAVILFDAKGYPIRLNPTAAAAYGFNMLDMDRAQSSRKINLRFADGSSIPFPQLPVSRALHGEIVHNERLLLTDYQGQERMILASASPIRNEAGAIQGACLVCNDITDAEAAQRLVQESQEQVAFHHQLIEHQEQKVDQIARDLHDGPVQNLLGVLFGLEAMIQDLQGNIEIPRAAQIESLQHNKMVIQRQIDSLFSFSKNLHPPVLSKFGLQEAMQTYIETWQTKHPDIHITLETQPGGDDLPEKVRMNLFRIFEESLTNVAKHAQATQVHIRLQKTSWSYEFSIQDNGTGFNIPKDLIILPREGKFGLASMQERAEAINSQLDMIAHLREGTFLRVIVPRNSPTN